jgi:hypothetical protein
LAGECGSNGRALSLQVQSSKFKPQYHHHQETNLIITFLKKSFCYRRVRKKNIKKGRKKTKEIQQYI